MPDIHATLAAWTDRRVKRGFYPIKEARSGKAEFHRHLGGRSIYAKVVLDAEPSDTFSFTSSVTWPDPRAEYYEEFVLDGILDELFTHSYHAVLGLRIHLKEIGWHEIDSCAAGYYQAARLAVKEILAFDEHRMNLESKRIYG